MEIMFHFYEMRKDGRGVGGWGWGVLGRYSSLYFYVKERGGGQNFSTSFWM